MKSFLEYISDFEITQRKIINHDLSRAKFHKLIEFYSTPFKPSLVEEYFEGFVLAAQPDNHHFYSKELHCRIWCEETELLLSIYANDKTENYRSILPETLEEFISDCNRVGISLTLKAEIEKEWFG